MQQTPVMSVQPQTPSRRALASILALVGTVLVWIPILAPLFFSLLHLAQTGRWLLDYLMPAELFSLAAAGACALVAASFLARSRLKLFAAAIAIGLAAIFGGSALAEVTGLASGEIEPTGWQWALVVACLAGYVLCVVALGVGGVLLLKDLLQRPRLPK
jgi:hypothetical protein